LQNKVGAEDNNSNDDNGGSAQSGGRPGKAWSADRGERQTLLQKRRDQMILEARRKMEAKIAAEKAAGAK
jgi:coupling of ubiquitin conjugation to ER degradation protein 1